MKKEFPVEAILRLLSREEDFVFLETARCDKENRLSYVFLRPERVVSTFKIARIGDCFAELDKALKQGRYVAGFLSYEAGEAFEQKLRHKQSYDFPLLWFGVYKEPLIYDHRRADFKISSAKSRALIKRIGLNKKSTRKNYRLKNIRPSISQDSYIKAIAKIKDLIARGFTYQVNYTFKLKFSFWGSPNELYLNLRNNQAVSYSAMIKAGRYFILSFSPELFFRKKGQLILTRPMKGTASRGKDLKEDKEIAQRLENCPKNRSENLMIVDLLRNDLGRISTTGSVRVPRLFNVERYQTIAQMTSDIESRLHSRYSAFDMFSHIFPSGSVTGAPKIKTMEIIKCLEKEPRNVYTGSIGFFSPERSGAFNVAIRTILLDKPGKCGEMGVGSGIVYDSSAKSEYAECRLKADFLTKQSQDFQLIETLLWQAEGGYLLMDAHLARLENSAGYFGFVYNKREILAALMKLGKTFGKHNYKARLILDKNGKINLESSALKAPEGLKQKVCFSRKKTDSQNPFLYHKTTNRKTYDREYARAAGAGFYDIIFTNEKDQITEGAISNIFIRKGGRLYTPPVKCGLLDGVYRRHMFSLGNYPLKEKTLRKRDLLTAEKIYLSNSVRGLVEVYLEGKNH
ncbi:MAG: aminodeoxychorismate synthase component I [Omnitrophica bacterium]|nr:aminodeoxychorismate synthase component I [Candidatus Omnitrophota bacterium]